MQRFYLLDSLECLYPFTGRISYETCPLPSGKHLCIMHHLRPEDRAGFEQQPMVSVFPALLSRKTLPDEQVAHLSHLGVTNEHTTFEAMEIICKTHPQFEVRLY